MKLKVLTDLHHRDLYYALHRLFDKRLDCELYRPIGLEWLHEGWWKIGDNEASHECQWLLRNGQGDNATTERCYADSCGVVNVWHPEHKYYAKGIPLNVFKQTRFDLILPSHSHHYFVWDKLRDLFQPKAKLVCHVGNVACNTELSYVIRSVPLLAKPTLDVLVHQEINTQIYRATPVNRVTKHVTSVTNGYHFPELFQQYKALLPDFWWRYFGAGSPDGVLHGLTRVASIMEETNLGWSTKSYGGLGHSNMGWMYSARPIITNMSEHRAYGESAVKLFEPGTTCIDIESNTVQENCKLIRKWMDPDTGNKHGEMAHKRFHEVINYEEEANNVKKFLAKIL